MQQFLVHFQLFQTRKWFKYCFYVYNAGLCNFSFAFESKTAKFSPEIFAKSLEILESKFNLSSWSKFILIKKSHILYIVGKKYVIKNKSIFMNLLPVKLDLILFIENSPGVRYKRLTFLTLVFLLIFSMLFKRLLEFKRFLLFGDLRLTHSWFSFIWIKLYFLKIRIPDLILFSWLCLYRSGYEPVARGSTRSSSVVYFHIAVSLIQLHTAFIWNIEILLSAVS